VVPYLAENEVSLMSYDVQRWLMIKVDRLEFYALDMEILMRRTSIT
jgi:hypothetical protein